MLTIKEAAAYLGVSTRSVRNYIKQGLSHTLEKTQYGEEYRFTRETLDDWKRSSLKSSSRFKRSDESNQATKSVRVERDEGDTSTRETSTRSTREQSSQRDELVETLKSEVQFLREQIREKDSVISQLTHTNSVLSLLTQDPKQIEMLREQRQDTQFSNEKTTPQKTTILRRIVEFFK